MKENKVAEQLTADNKNTSVLLEMQDIEKAFPGVKALDKVNLTVKAGTVHALMGENGAGKSTLMKCLFGVYTKDAGKIFLEGREINFKNSKEALENGVAMVHQELNQALKRNVMDNMWFLLLQRGFRSQAKERCTMRQSRFSINSGSMSTREP